MSVGAGTKATGTCATGCCLRLGKLEEIISANQDQTKVLCGTNHGSAEYVGAGVSIRCGAAAFATAASRIELNERRARIKGSNSLVTGLAGTCWNILAGVPLALLMPKEHKRDQTSSRGALGVLIGFPPFQERFVCSGGRRHTRGQPIRLSSSDQ